MLTDTEAGLALAVPVNVYLTVVWVLFLPHSSHARTRRVEMPVAVVAILAAAFTPEPVLLGGLVSVALVAMSVAAPPVTAEMP